MDYEEKEIIIRNITYKYFSNSIIDEDTENYVTIGFKLNKPVLKLLNSVSKGSVLLEHAANKETDSALGKRSFIFINGQKVGVVPTKLNMPVKCNNNLIAKSFDKLATPQFLILKSCEGSQLPGRKVIQTLTKLPSSNIKIVQHVSTTELASNSARKDMSSEKCSTESSSESSEFKFNSARKDVSSEKCSTESSSESSEFNFNKDPIVPLKTYSKKNGNGLIQTNDKKSSYCEIDYEKKHMNNMRTYKGPKGMSDASTSCHNLCTMIEASAQTENQRTDIGVQTEFSLISQFLASPSKCDYAEEIIEDRFLTLFDGNESAVDGNQQTKLQFYEDFRSCLTFDAKGNLPIHEGVLTNDAKLVKRNCVVLKARQENVDVLNHDNLTPLQLAVLNETGEDIITLLLDYDADLGVMDGEGNTVLHLAVEHNRPNALKILLKFHKCFDIDTFNYEGFSPLMLCCINKLHGMAEILLDSGADPNLRDLKSGRTALFHAAENHDVEMVRLLLAHKANTKIRNFFGTSPHDAMFEVEDIPKGIKYEILGRDLHMRSLQKKKTHISKMEHEKKRIKFTEKTLQVVPKIQKIETLTLFKK